MRHLAMIAVAFSMAAAPTLAEPRLGSVSGNWAGASGEGYSFEATLQDDKGGAHLWIFNSPSPDIASSIPAFDKQNITLRNADVTRGRQTLEVVEGPDSTVLQIVSQYSTADRQVVEVVKAQFLDFQFTVTGYTISVTNLSGEKASQHDCKLDFRANSRVVDGVTGPIPSRSSEDDNLWYWGPNVAFERGLCPVIAAP